MPSLPLLHRTLRFGLPDPAAPYAPRAGRACGACVTRVLQWLAVVLLAVALAGISAGVRAETPELATFDAVRTDEGVMLSFGVRFELPHAVEEALHKGVPLYFVARAEVVRTRWYWRDRKVANVERIWRLAFQPLTRKYRVSFGGLHQNFDSLSEALLSVTRVVQWKLADASQIDPDGTHQLEFSYRLDTSLLPRPMQIGVGGQAEWNLRLDRVQRID